MEKADASSNTKNGGPTAWESKVLHPLIGHEYHSRWPEPVTDKLDFKEAAMLMEQLHVKDWPAAKCDTESEFDDWLDAVANIVRLGTNQVNVKDLLHKLFLSMPERRQKAIMNVSQIKPKVVEDWIDAAARIMFRDSVSYSFAFANCLQYKQEDLVDICSIVVRKLDRLMIYERRWVRHLKRPEGQLTAETIMGIIYSLLPDSVSSKVDMSFKEETLVEQLQTIQERMMRKQQQQQLALPPPRTTRQVYLTSNREPHGPCPCCGERHWRKDCRNINTVCSNCGIRGHIAKVCRNLRHYDGLQQPHIWETKRGGGFIHRHPGVSSNRQKLERTKDLVAEQVEREKTSNQKSSERAKRKRTNEDEEVLARGHEILARATKEGQFHDQLVKFLKSVDKKDRVTLQQMMGSYEENLKESVSSRPVVEAYIHGKKFKGMLDSGADFSVLNRTDAASLLTREPDRYIDADTVGGPVRLPIYEGVEIEVGGRKKKVIVAISDYVHPSLLGREFILGMQQIVYKAMAVNMPYLDQQHITSGKYIEQPSSKSAEPNNYEIQRKLFNEKHSDLSMEDKQDIWSILHKYKEAWENPKCAKVSYIAEFVLKEGARPFKARLRHYEPGALAELKKQVRDQLQEGVIRPSKSSWAAAPHLVPKKTGEWRVVIDYRHLNAQMVADVYPIPRLWSNTQKIAEKAYYITLDMNKGFFNIPISEKSKPLTAFITPDGLFEFNVIPFGIKNSPAEFQRSMDVTFASVLDDSCLAYIDDIIIAGNSRHAVLEKLIQVLKLCISSGFYLRLDKCEFMKSEVAYLGFVVGKSGIKLSNKRKNALVKMEKPQSKKDLQSFLGLAGQFSRFIPKYSSLTAPLFRLLRKQNTTWTWNSDNQLAFDNIKSQLNSDTILHAPSPGLPYIIYCDASSLGIGASLWQRSDPISEDKVLIEYASKKFVDAELKWNTAEQELFAIKWSIDHWRDYVALTKFDVYTDHANLKYLINNDKGKIFRWCIYLSQFNFDLHYIAGRLNNVADYLSRYGRVDENDDDLIDTISLQVHLVKSRLQIPTLPTSIELQLAAQKEFPAEGVSNVIDSNGRLINKSTSIPWVPPSLRTTIITNFHHGQHAHSSINKTVKKIKPLYFWNNMQRDVASFVRSCLICARIKPKVSHTTKKKYGTLDHPEALELISLDHVGPLFRGNNNTYILVIIDHATRFMVAPLVSNLTAATTLTAFEDNWIHVFGPPHYVLTDQGASFKGIFQSTIITEYGIKHFKSAPRRPEGNGLNERSHATLKTMCAAILSEYDVSLDKAIKLAVSAYNTTPHFAMHISPHEALFGKLPVYAKTQHIANLQGEENRKKLLHARARDRAISIMLKDRTLKPAEEFNVGDTVVTLHNDRVKGIEAEMHLPELESSWAQPTWTFPMKVIKTTDTQVTMTPYGHGSKEITRHKDHVKKFYLPEDLLSSSLLKQYIESTLEAESKSNTQHEIATL